jgi:hypothetical protein
MSSHGLTDPHRVAALQFVKSKGRMPLDRLELIEWLMEFTFESGDLARRIQQAFELHLRVCNSRSFGGTKE